VDSLPHQGEFFGLEKPIETSNHLFIDFHSVYRNSPRPSSRHDDIFARPPQSAGVPNPNTTAVF